MTIVEMRRIRQLSTIQISDALEDMDSLMERAGFSVLEDE